MLKNWFKIFLYNSLKNKLFFLLTVFGLAIGMTGVILAMSYWEDENSYNQWNPNKDNIYEVIIEFNNEIWPWQVAPLGYYAKEKSSLIEDYMYFSPNYFNTPIAYQDKNIYLKNIINVQSNFFDFFPLEIIAGSSEKFKNTVDAIAIEEKQVAEIFGNEIPLGKSFKTAEGGTFVVTTIYKNNNKSSIKANFLIKEVDNIIKKGIEDNNWGSYSHGLLIKLNDNSNLSTIRKQIYDVFYEKNILKNAKKDGISPEKLLEEYGNLNFQLISLSDTRLSNNKIPTSLPEKKGNITLLYINIGLSLLILIISIFNYINLSTAYAIKRAKEIGLRKVIGANRLNIILQQVFETLIISIIALIIALALVEILLPSYNLLLNKKLEIDFFQYIPHFVILTGIVVLFAGIFPALYIANFEILKVLKGNFSRSKSGIWLRNGMIITQFTIATFFIISGIIISKQVNYISKKDLGFQADQIISVGWDKSYNNKYKEYLRIKQDLLKIPGVTDVNTSTFTIGLGASSSSSYTYKEKTIQAQNMSIDYDYLKLFNIRLESGRDFNSQLASDSTHAILLNRTAATAFGDKDILGKELTAYGNKVKVIGIVNDFHLYGLESKTPPMVFTHIKFVDWMQNNISTISVKIKAENIDKTIAQIESYWKNSIDNTRPFNFEFVNKLFARTYQDYVNQRNLFAILNLVVIAIALLGLFAIASYSIERRYKEIAIKKVLGIITKQLISNLTSQYFILLVIGFVLAILPSYYIMEMWLSNFAYRIDMPWSGFIIAFILMFILTAIVVISKAYNATRISALNYLKYE